MRKIKKYIYVKNKYIIYVKIKYIGGKINIGVKNKIYV